MISNLSPYILNIQHNSNGMDNMFYLVGNIHYCMLKHKYYLVKMEDLTEHYKNHMKLLLLSKLSKMNHSPHQL
jgi:hypothetical protein